MEEALSFFRAFEVWIYLLLGLGGLIYIRKFILAWQELRGASFGLERDSAQARLNQSASMLVLLLTLAVAEFVLVSFIAPSVPGAIPLFTPTIDLLATPTTTLPPTSAEQLAEPTGEQATGVPEPPTQIVLSGQEGCQPGSIEILSPSPGEEVSGVVPIMGSADIDNFGFYMFQMKHPEDPESAWLTLQAGNIAVTNGKLGDWDTRRLSPGEYQLALIVVDNQAQTLAPCIVQVRVTMTVEETPLP